MNKIVSKIVYYKFIQNTNPVLNIKKFVQKSITNIISTKTILNDLSITRIRKIRPLCDGMFSREWD